MLKLIRKYQLIILAIGGSLLMVVFLFQPIIGKLSPDPRKSAVGKLTDGTSFNGFDFQRASFDLSVLKRVYPRVFAPIEQGGLGLNRGAEDKTELHWLLLSKQATDAGLVGDSGEGRTWISTIATRESLSMVQQQVQQGLLQITTNAELRQAAETLTPQIESGLRRNVSLATGMMRGMTEDDVYRTLATARGVERLFRVFTSIPTFSDLGAMHAAKSRYDSVAVDAVLIKGELFAGSIPEASEDDLSAFFDRYKGDSPSDNEFQIGYTQPTRVKLGWLKFDRQAIEAAVVIDRVELNKIWRTDHQLQDDLRKYPGDFAGERAKIEKSFRQTRARDIMIEADKIIRSRVLQATRGLSKEDGLFVLPGDWDSTRPSLESIAQAVVDGVKDQMGVELPLPSVDIHTDRWLDSDDISSVEGFGRSSFRIGSRKFPTFFIPQLFETEEAQALLTIQTGIPVVDPAAEDGDGNRYYSIVYELNEAGPADSIDHVGREQVLNDYRNIEAYKELIERLEVIRSAGASANDLAPAVDAALEMGDDDLVRPGVARNLLVRSEAVGRGRLASFVEPGLNSEAFREAVLDAASGLDELTSPDQVAQSPIVIAVPLPGTRGIGLARVVAPRPMTSDLYKGAIGQILRNESGAEIRDAINETGSMPFSLEALSDRYGYTRVKKQKGAEEEPALESDQDSESGIDQGADQGAGG